MELRKRIEFVDIAKGIGIMLVCFAHSGAEAEAMTWIGGFIVPLFFILSGYMYKDKCTPVGRTLWVIANKLLKPYFFFSILLLIITGKHEWNDIAGIFYSRYCLYPYHSAENIYFMQATNSPMWFLTAMMAAYPLFFLIMKREKHALWIALAYLLLTFGFTRLPILLPWGIDIAFLMALFMYFGVQLRRHENILNKHANITFPIILLAFIVLCKINGEPNVSVRIYGNAILLYLMTGILGTLTVIWLSKHLEGKPFSRLLADFGRHSLVIFCLQIYVFHQFNRVVYGMLHVPATGVWLYTISILKVIVACIICLFISKLMMRYMPWLFKYNPTTKK